MVAEVDGLMTLMSLLPASTSGSAARVRDSLPWRAGGGYLGREICEVEASGEERLMFGILNVVGVVLFVVPMVLDRPRPVNTRNGRPLPST